MQDDRLDYPELETPPALQCAQCGLIVPMAKHYAQVTMEHKSDGTHAITFVAESAWRGTL